MSKGLLTLKSVTGHNASNYTYPPGVRHESEAMVVKTTSDTEKVINRLRRVEGQIRGLQRMITEEKGCEDVLTQLAATKAALDRVGVYLISHRMKECLSVGSAAQLENGNEQESAAALEEAFEVFMKYVQCVR